ncbi:MAG: hypothetical protein ACRC8Q_01315 [Aeromonas sp.]
MKRKVSARLEKKKNKAILVKFEALGVIDFNYVERQWYAHCYGCGDWSPVYDPYNYVFSPTEHYCHGLDRCVL